MKLGVYTAILHDKPLAEALRVVRELGLEGLQSAARVLLEAAGRVPAHS